MSGIKKPNVDNFKTPNYDVKYEGNNYKASEKINEVSYNSNVTTEEMDVGPNSNTFENVNIIDGIKLTFNDWDYLGLSPRQKDYLKDIYDEYDGSHIEVTKLPNGWAKYEIDDNGTKISYTIREDGTIAFYEYEPLYIPYSTSFDKGHIEISFDEYGRKIRQTETFRDGVQTVDFKSFDGDDLAVRIEWKYEDGSSELIVIDRYEKNKGTTSGIPSIDDNGMPKEMSYYKYDENGNLVLERQKTWLPKPNEIATFEIGFHEIDYLNGTESRKGDTGTDGISGVDGGRSFRDEYTEIDVKRR